MTKKKCFLIIIFSTINNYYNRFTALLDFVWDNPGEPVPER